MIPTYTDWLMRLQPARPRALGQIFDWCVTTAAVDMEPRVLVAQFGDGYAQRRPNGINYQPQVWNVEMRNAQEADVRAAFDFLKARGGVDVFNWYQPRTDLRVDVICPQWSMAYGDLLDSGQRLFALTARFEEAYL
jgi:phage-related protein